MEVRVRGLGGGDAIRSADNAATRDGRGRERLRKKAASVHGVDGHPGTGKKAGSVLDILGEVTPCLGRILEVTHCLERILQVGAGENSARKRAGKPHKVLAPRHTREVASQLIEGGKREAHAKIDAERILLGIELLQLVHHHFADSQVVHGQA